MKESELVNRWLWKFHKDALQWRRVRLGAVPTKEMAQLYKVILRWCDAIFIENGTVNLVEAKIRPTAGAIGQLDHYAILFRKTPEFKEYWNYPLKKILLTMTEDLEIRELCKARGIDFVLFKPE